MTHTYTRRSSGQAEPPPAQNCVAANTKHPTLPAFKFGCLDKNSREQRDHVQAIPRPPCAHGPRPTCLQATGSKGLDLWGDQAPDVPSAAAGERPGEDEREDVGPRHSDLGGQLEL